MTSQMRWAFPEPQIRHLPRASPSLHLPLSTTENRFILSLVHIICKVCFKDSFVLICHFCVGV